MKKILITLTSLCLASFLNIAIAQTNNNTEAANNTNDMTTQASAQDLNQMNDLMKKWSTMKVSMMGKKMMLMGTHMRMMGMAMANADDQSVKQQGQEMMQMGLKMYMMGQKLNNGQALDLDKMMQQKKMGYKQ